MSEMYEKFPEMLLVDATYKLTHIFTSRDRWGWIK